MTTILIILAVLLYSAICILASGLYIGLDLPKSQARVQPVITILVSILWPASLILGLATLTLLATYRLATLVQNKGFELGYGLADYVENLRVQ